MPGHTSGGTSSTSFLNRDALKFFSKVTFVENISYSLYSVAVVTCSVCRVGILKLFLLKCLKQLLQAATPGWSSWKNFHALAVPDLGKFGHYPGKILVNCGYCLQKLVAASARMSPGLVPWQLWNCQYFHVEGLGGTQCYTCYLEA